MTVINTNISSLNARFHLDQVNKSMDQAMERLSSGSRINSASDDAAGLAIVSKMDAQIRGLSQAIRNANDGMSLANTAEGAMDEVENMLQRMRELAIQASNDTFSASDRANLDAEVKQLKSEIDRVVTTTTFNDIKLLDGSYKGSLQIGSKANETIDLSIANISTSSLGTVSGAAAGSGAVEISARGTEAVENVVNLSFNGNDTYGFTVTLGNVTGAGAGNKEISISNVVMAGGDATAIANALNVAIAANKTDATNTGFDLSGVLTASAVGNTVTLNAKDGSEIDITAFTSTGLGSMTVNQVTNSSAASKTLENTTEIASLTNTGGTTAVASTGVLQLDEDRKYSFRVNNALIEVSGDTTQGASVATAIQNAIDATSGAGSATVTFNDDGSVHTYNISDSTGKAVNISGFQKLSTQQVQPGFMTIDPDNGTASDEEIIEHNEFMTADQNTNATGLGIADGKTGVVKFSNQNLSYTFGIAFGANQGDTSARDKTYVVDGTAGDFMGQLSAVAAAISADGGANIAAYNNGGQLEIVNTSGAALTFEGDVAISSPGVSAVAEGSAYFLRDSLADGDADTDGEIGDEAAVVTLQDGSMVSTSDGVEAVISEMSLSFSGDDRYTFVIDKDNDGGSDATITADIVNGSKTGIVNAINSHSSSTGVEASLSGNQVILKKADGTDFQIKGFDSESGGKIFAANASGQGGAATLEKAGDGASVQVNASGAAVPTLMDLTFSGSDKFSFQISDGTSTAIVRATTTGATTANQTDLLAEIQSALAAANMSHVTAADNTNMIRLTNALGGELKITNFKSDGSETMTAQPKVGQGGGKILDDNAISATGAAIASIDVLSTTTAQSAIATIDRALENVSTERASIGAVTNRLEHTVSNLSNVVVNTEASKSAIQDADFASETSNLTKTQILSQAATAMLAQANQSKQSVLALLQG